MHSPGLVHDYLLVMRGAERTFAAIADCFSNAPVYALLYDPEAVNGRFRGRRVEVSYLQRLRVGQEGFRRLLPLFPRAAEALPVQEHDLIVSSSSAFAHGVRPREDAVHICYCHTPFRYVWHERGRALDEAPAPLRPLLRRTLERVRRWDVEASRRVTHYIANSRITQERIAEFWGRDSTIVHPPVEVERFHSAEPEDYFLVVCQLVRHKRVDLALEAARRAGKRVKVVGQGPELPRLKETFAGTAEFHERTGDDELAHLYAGARALVLPNVEEFGIAAVEAQAAGRPVLAADAGGARETVVDGETGVRVPPGEVDAFAEALREVDFERFDPERIRANADRFSTSEFQRLIRSEVARLAGSSEP